MSIRTVPKPILVAGFASWKALAVAIDVSDSLLCHVRARRAPLSANLRAKLAAALNLPPDDVDAVLWEVAS